MHSAKRFRRKTSKMTLKQTTSDNFSCLLRCMDPSCHLLGRMRSVPFVKDRISLIDEQLTDDDKNYTLLNILSKVPDDIEESVMNGFIAALRSSGQDHVANIFRRESDKVPMSDEHTHALTANVHQLRKFLDPENGLLDELISINVISLTDAQYIRSMSGYSEMVQKLIEVLTRKSDDAFDAFINALNQTGQSHVSYMLTGQSESGKVPMSDEHHHALRVKTDDLCRFTDPENRLLDVLFSTEVISSLDDQSIRSLSQSGHNKMTRRLVEVLTRKSDDAFYGFINALNQTGQSHVTYILTGQSESGKVPMSDEHYNTLTANIDRLCQFIDPENGLLDKLVSNNVISLTNAEYIRSGIGYNEVARKLIEVLMRKSDDAFDGFISALNQTGQSHVTYMLTGQGDSRSVSEESRDKLMEKRFAAVMSIFAHDLVSALISKGVFSSYDQQRVEARQTNDGKVETMVDLIARKSQAAFDSFIETLRECNHNHVAEKLTGSEVSGNIQARVSTEKAVEERKDVEAELCKQMQHTFDNNNTEVKQLNGLLASDGISVPQVSEGSIIVKFKCRDYAAVVSLQELYSSKKLDQLFTESFLPKFADKGLESLSLHIPDKEFQRCFQLKLMTDEHRELLWSAEDWLLDKMVVSEELLDKLSLSGRRRQTIETAATHEEQVKTLLDIVSRQPDCAFTELLTALKDTNQHEAADIISGDGRSEASCRPSGKLFSV